MARQVPAAPCRRWGDNPTSVQGELFMQLQQMQDELARLRGTLEEQQNQIQQPSRKAWNATRTSTVGLPVVALPLHRIPHPLAPSTPRGACGSAGNNAPAPSSEPGDPAKELYYDAAFDLIKSKDFDKASQAFNAFLRKYPNSQYSGNAQYWLGGTWPRATCKVPPGLRAGQPELRPEGARLSVQAGDVERRLGNNDKAKGILQQVISQYPGTSAAQLAQRDLKNLR